MPAAEETQADGPLPLAEGEAPPVARSAALVTAGIVLSRLAGLARQRVFAHYFGLSIQADAISAGFKVANVAQNLLGEGTLSASFIPVYSKLRAAGRPGDASRFARSALGLLTIVLLVGTAVSVLAAPWITKLFAIGFTGEKLDLTVRVVRVALPMTAVLVLSAWALGVLNAHRRFFLSYAAPVAWSLTQIAVMIGVGTWLHHRGETLTMALAWGAFAGAVLQLLVLLPPTRALLGGLAPRFERSDPGVREAAGRLPATLLGRGAIQISGLIDLSLVSLLGDGANAVFQNAQTIYLLPMSVLGTGEAAASLPEMASDTTETDVAKRDATLRSRLGASLGRIAVLAAPASAALIVFPVEIVTVLLQGGSFDRGSTERVAAVIGVYGFALLANAAVRVLAATCFALGDTKRPATYGVVRVVVSTAFSVLLMRRFGVMGVVAGAVIAAWVEAFALGRLVRRGIGGLGLGQIPLARVIVLAAACTGAGLGARALLPTAFAATPLGGASILATFSIAFALAAPALGLLRIRSLLRRG